MPVLHNGAGNSAQQKNKMCIRDRFQIVFIKQRRGKNAAQVDLHSLTKLVDAPQLHRRVCAVHKITAGGLRYAAVSYTPLVRKLCLTSSSCKSVTVPLRSNRIGYTLARTTMVLPSTNILSTTPKSVSYTHLDVYKRQAFLTTAARRYRYPYNEQLMIFAQRPDATACAEYDLWNKQMRRYVRRGSKGIALVDLSLIHI